MTKPNQARTRNNISRSRLCSRILSLSSLVCPMVVCGVWFQYDLLSQQQQPPHLKPKQNENISLENIFMLIPNVQKSTLSTNRPSVRPTDRPTHFTGMNGREAFNTIVPCKSFLRYFQFAIFAHSVQTEKYNEIRYL